MNGGGGMNGGMNGGNGGNGGAFNVEQPRGLMVIGAGLGRTGTQSLQEALNILGYPCYHMREVRRLRSPN